MRRKNSSFLLYKKNLYIKKQKNKPEYLRPLKKTCVT